MESEDSIILLFKTKRKDIGDHMKINGIGTVKKEDAMSILTKEGREAVKTGDITLEELGQMYKLEQVKKESTIGNLENTFRESYKWIPDELKDQLAPKQLGKLADQFCMCYRAGKNASKKSKQMKYYIIDKYERNARGELKKYTFEEVKNFFKPSEEGSDDYPNLLEKWNDVQDLFDLRDFLEFEADGMEVHYEIISEED